MSDFSNAQKDALANSSLRQATYTEPAAYYVRLIMADGTTEATGNAYARQTVTWTAFSGGAASSNSAAVTFPTATGTWGTGDVTYFQSMDAVTGGNQLSAIKALTTPRTVANNVVVRFAIAALTFTW